MSDVCEVVITAPNAEWLASFTRHLIEDRLCAGAHQITTIQSIYRWEGVVHDRLEARVALHTLTAHVHDIVERANAEHPYEVPCVIVLPIPDGNPAYLRWIVDETRPA